MSEKMKHTCKLTALSAALLAVFGPALAQDGELTQLTKPESNVSVGAGYLSNDQPEQGQYNGLRNSGGYILLDGSVVKRDDATGTWFIVKARNLGLQDRDIYGEVLQQGVIGGYIGFSQVPHYSPWTFNTGLQGIGYTQQTVSGAGANAFPIGSGTLNTRRDTTTLGFYDSLKKLVPGLELKVDFKNTDKTGNLNWGAYTSQQFFLANPIDSTTQELDVKFNYSRERLQLTGGYYGSWYNQNASQVSALINGVAQPGSTNSPNPLYLSEPLSNQANQVYLDGGYNFTDTTRGTFKLSYQRATQNETFPSWNLPAPNDPFVGTPSSLNGRVDTTLAEGAITSRIIPKLTLLAKLRYYDVDDKTPVIPVEGSNATGVATAWNTPYSYRTKSGKVEASYWLPANFNLIGDIDVKSQDRSYPTQGTLVVPFVQQLNEANYSAQVRRNLSDTLNGSLQYVYGTREGKDWVYTNNAAEDAINPMNIADRTQNKWRLVLDWAPMDKLSLQFVAENAKDNYKTNAAQPYGLLDGSAQLYSLDASFELSDAWRLTAWYTYNVNKTTEFGFRQAGGGAADATKTANLEETGNSLGIGVRGQPHAKLKLGADLEWYKTDNAYPVDIVPVGAGALYPTSGPVTVGPLPDINNTLTRFKFFAQYAIQKNADLRFDLIYARYHTNDWTWSLYPGVAPWVYGQAGGAIDGTTVTQPQNQPATFVGLRYIYKFF
jgi:MtrB/PioB family decaheme-associated outer membrane protein